MSDRKDRTFGSGGRHLGPHPDQPTGPIGGGRLTGVGGGRLSDVSDGGRALSRHESVGRGGSGHGRGGPGGGTPGGGGPSAGGSAGGGRGGRRGVGGPAIVALGSLLLVLLLGGAAVLFLVLGYPVSDHTSDGDLVEDDWDSWMDDDMGFSTTAVPAPEIFEPEPAPDEGDPTKDFCVDGVEGRWSGFWASNRGIANGRVDLAVGSSGTTVEGTVALSGNTPINGGQVRGEINCRVVALGVIDPLTGEEVIGFTGIVSADGSSIRGPYTATTNADGSTSVLDQGTYLLIRL